MFLIAPLYCFLAYFQDIFSVDTTPFVDDYFANPKKHAYDWRDMLPGEDYLSNVSKFLDYGLKISTAKWIIVIGHRTIRSAGHDIGGSCLQQNCNVGGHRFGFYVYTTVVIITCFVSLTLLFSHAAKNQARQKKSSFRTVQLGHLQARLNAFNQCSSIEANTTIDNPYVVVKTSGARLLYTQEDFLRFVKAIDSTTWPSRIKQSNSCSASLLAEDGSYKIDWSISMKEHLRLLPSDLICFERQTIGGLKQYTIVGRVIHPQTLSLLGGILQEFSGHEDVTYTETFSRYEIPEWFCISRNSSLLAFPLNPMNGWKGLVACALFTVLGNLDSEKLEIACNWEINRLAATDNIWINKSDISLKDLGFICMFYASHGLLSNNPSNGCTSIKARFYSNNKNITVQSCGYQVVCDENMEEFMETVRQCSITSQLSKDASREENGSTATRPILEKEKRKSPWTPGDHFVAILSAGYQFVVFLSW